MKSTPFLVVLLFLSLPARAAFQGRASLAIVDAVTGASHVEAAPGDTIVADLRMDAGTESVTGVELFLTLDDRGIELLPESVASDGAPVPFVPGGFVDGTVYSNDTIDDRVGRSLANGLPGFQLRYTELLGPSLDGIPRTTSGRGAVARVTLVVVGEPGTRAMLGLDAVSAVGSASGYFQPRSPGTAYRFRRVAPLEVRIVGRRGTPGGRAPDAGDFDGDGDTDFADFVAFAAHFGAEKAGGYDLNGDGAVDFGDFMMLSQYLRQQP